MKEIFLNLLAVACMLFATSMGVSAETQNLNYGNWIGYENSDGTLTVTGCRSLEEYVSDGILTIPSEIENMTVTKVDGYTGLLAYYFDIFSPELVETLILPDTVTYIDTETFGQFQNLTKIVFPNNDELELGYDICGDNENITDVTRRGYISNRGIDLSNVTTLTIHEGVKTINIWENYALITLNLPSTITTVDFWKNPELTTVNCSKSLDEISIIHMADCPNLCIPVHVFETEEYSASGYGIDSFANSGATSITIDAAFLTGDYLKKDTFKDCPNLTGIYINGDSNFHSEDGVLFWKNHLFAYPAAKSTATNYTVPGSVECIYVYAFSGCHFTSVTIPEDIDVSYYWDYAINEQYQDEDGNWQNRRVKLMTHLPNTKVYVVKGTAACDSYGTKATVADSIGGTESQVEFYPGSTYSISYELNGGTNHPDNPASYQLGADVVTLQDPTREGYTFLGWKRNDVTYRYINTTEFIYNASGVNYNYTFTAEWEEEGKISFTDVADEKLYYYNAVYWAVENNITSGYSNTQFAPDMPCTRSQVVTFLWRAAGRPEPKTAICPFTDVPDNAYYRKAVLWAVENNITSGLSNTLFGPEVECSRAQIVTFMWRYAGKPAPKTTTCSFVDVEDTIYYRNAVLWAVENGITSGYSSTHFAPDLFCTRGQIVTFLYRAYRQ